MDGQTDGGDSNIPIAFLEWRGDNNVLGPLIILWGIYCTDNCHWLNINELSC